MGYVMLYPPKCKFLTPFKWQKKKRTKYFQQYVHDAKMIQAENDNISLSFQMSADILWRT